LNDKDQSTSPVATQGSAPIRKSKGEVFFDRAVYGGLAGVGTFIATIFMADKLKHGSWKGLHRSFAKGIESVMKWVAPGRNHAESAEKAAMTTSLMMGAISCSFPLVLQSTTKYRW